MELPDWKVTEWMGIYGAVLATWTLIHNVSARRTKLRIRAMPYIENAMAGALVVILNGSEHSVTIGYAEMYVRTQSRLKQLAAFLWIAVRHQRLSNTAGWTPLKIDRLLDPLPTRLDPRAQLQIFVPEYIIMGEIDRLQEVVQIYGARVKFGAQDGLLRTLHSNKYRYGNSPYSPGNSPFREQT